MPSLYLELTLLSPVSLSATARTAGGHHTLDHIPGSNLLGVLGQHYGTLGDDAWPVFHSGAVRFGDGLPASPDGGPSYPMPLSLHWDKARGSEPIHKQQLPWDRLRSAEIVNLARCDAHGAMDGEPKQLSSGYIDRGLRRVRPKKTLTMRTAIEPGTGRALDRALYTVESLDPGQVFLSRLDADDLRLLERVRSLLADRNVQLGRSRSAELGRVQVREVSPWPERAPASAVTSGELLLYCASDLALRDPHTGQPTLRPCAAHFGLPETVELARSRTFLGTRAYTPFHGHRKRPDLERQVIQAGSVLVFRGEGIDPAALAETLRSGVGEHRQDGLGQIWVEPPLLASRWLPMPRLAAPSKTSKLTPELPADALGAWLGPRIVARAAEEEAHTLADQWERSLGSASNLSASQWRRVGDLARRAAGAPDPRAAFQTDFNILTTSGLAKLGARWGRRITIDGQQQTLKDHVLRLVAQRPDASEAVHAVEIVAHRLARAAATEGQHAD